MKIDKFLWSRIFFNNKELLKNELASILMYELAKIANLKDFNYIKNEFPFDDNIWELSEKLGEIDLNSNKNLEEEFFKEWKKMPQINKEYKYAESEYKIFNKEFKKYFLDRIVENPAFDDLWFFRKNISQENLRKGLNNFFNHCIFRELKNQPNGKHDYWDNIYKNGVEKLTYKDRKNLIELLELADMNENDLNKFDTIGFLHNIMQAKFDKLLKKEIKKEFIEVEEKEIYLIDIKINALTLLNEDKNLSIKKINEINEGIYKLFNKTVQLDKINANLINYQRLKMLAFSKESCEEASIKVRAINEWLEKNKNEIANYMEILNGEESKIKEFGEKIVLKYKIEKSLVKENKIKTNKSKI